MSCRPACLSIARFCGLLALCLLLALPSSAMAQENEIEFHSLIDALEKGIAEEKVTIVYVTAQWCGWCRKMEANTFPDEKVQALAEHYVFAKVDADKEHHFSAMLNVRGLPALRLYNARGELLDTADGYLGPVPFAEMLTKHKDNANAEGLARQEFGSLVKLLTDLERVSADDADPADRTQVIMATIEELSNSDLYGRVRAEHQILQMKEKAWPTLVAMLRHEQLSIRAAAYVLLQASSEHDLEYDPFADPAVREEQAEQWTDWVNAAVESSSSDLDQTPQDAHESAQPSS